MRLTGLMVPNAFETCIMPTNFVCLLNNFSYSSTSSSPASLIGTTRIFASFSSANICHGTMFE